MIVVVYVSDYCCKSPTIIMESITVDEAELANLVGQAKDYLMSHGLVLRTVGDPDNGDLVTHAPVTLFPSPVPRSLYEQAQAVQQDINLLMHRIAHDYEFLKTALQQVILVDDFTRRLWDIYETVTKEGLSQPFSLGMNRSDYMFDCGTPTSEVISSGKIVNPSEIKLRMIEVNTMASSFNGLSQHLKDYHRFILERVGKYSEIKQIPPAPSEPKAADVLASSLVSAWECYGNPGAVILFLVLDPERNLYDQRHLEYCTYRVNPKVKVIRRSFRDVVERAQLTKEKNLLIDGEEVAVLYQRMLYDPEHYTSDKDWSTRLLLERSRAIKCPSAGYHLAGTKKVQQLLAQPGTVERFLQGEECVARVRDTFAGQYSLDLGSEGDEAVTMAMKDPHLYVMKPQREGGGNNVFGEDIRTKLADIRDSSERTAYILMDHIHPYPVQNYMIRSGEPIQKYSCVNELGIYGAFVGTADEVLLNHSGGCCLRTKTVGTNEGGVATGYSCLDSPLLV